MTDVIVGIDLGTTNSVVAHCDSSGVPRALPNDKGEVTHASIVAFTDGNRIIVGNRARGYVTMQPSTTVYSAKRLLGRHYSSEDIQAARKRLPYTLVEGKDGSVLVEVLNKQLSIPEVSAFILTYLKRVAERSLKTEVERAVITVPAHFNDNQRHATKAAAIIAGLKPVRLLSEPTAAALAYGLRRGLRQKVVVFDLGGGTFDMSVLDIDENVFEVLACGGDTYLGGDDFDEALSGLIVDIVKEELNIDLQEVLEDALLRMVAEKAKVRLSGQNRAVVTVPKVRLGKEVRDVDIPIRRPRFQEAIFDLAQRTFQVCDRVLREARLGTDDVDKVLCVGGQTLTPLITSMVASYFGKKPMTGANPLQVVALGAAIEGWLLSGDQGLEPVELWSESVDDQPRRRPEAILLDVTPHTLRLATTGGYTVPIVPKNTPIPFERVKRFTTAHDYQEKVSIRIYQGEQKREDGNEMLGEFSFSGFKAKPREETAIDVTFELDADGILQVHAIDLDTGLKAETTVELTTRLSDTRLQQMVAEHRGLIPKEA